MDIEAALEQVLANMEQHVAKEVSMLTDHIREEQREQQSTLKRRLLELEEVRQQEIKWNSNEYTSTARDEQTKRLLYIRWLAADTQQMAILGVSSVAPDRNFAGCYLNAVVQALLSASLFISLVGMVIDTDPVQDSRYATLAIFKQLLRISMGVGKERGGGSLNLAPLHRALAAGPYRDGLNTVWPAPKLQGETQEEASVAYQRILEMLRLGTPSVDESGGRNEDALWVDRPFNPIEYKEGEFPAGGGARTAREYMDRIGHRPTIWDWLTLWVELHIFKCTRCGRCVEELETFDRLVLRGPVTPKRRNGKRDLVTLDQLLANYGRTAKRNKRLQHCPSETCRHLGDDSEYKSVLTTFARLPPLMVIEIELAHPNDPKKKLNFDLDFSPDISCLAMIKYEEGDVPVPVEYLAAVAHTSHNQLSTQSGHYYTYARRTVPPPPGSSDTWFLDVCIDDSHVQTVDFQPGQDGVIDEFRRTNLLFFSHSTPDGISKKNDSLFYWHNVYNPKYNFQQDYSTESESMSTNTRVPANEEELRRLSHEREQQQQQQQMENDEAISWELTEQQLNSESLGHASLDYLTDAELGANLSVATSQADSDPFSVGEWAHRLAQLPAAQRQQMERLMPLDTETQADVETQPLDAETQQPGSETQDPYAVLVPESPLLDEVLVPETQELDYVAAAVQSQTWLNDWTSTQPAAAATTTTAAASPSRQNKRAKSVTWAPSPTLPVVQESEESLDHGDSSTPHLNFDPEAHPREILKDKSPRELAGLVQLPFLDNQANEIQKMLHDSYANIVRYLEKELQTDQSVITTHATGLVARIVNELVGQSSKLCTDYAQRPGRDGPVFDFHVPSLTYLHSAVSTRTGYRSQQRDIDLLLAYREILYYALSLPYRVFTYHPIALNSSSSPGNSYADGIFTRHEIKTVVAHMLLGYLRRDGCTMAGLMGSSSSDPGSEKLACILSYFAQTDLDENAPSKWREDLMPEYAASPRFPRPNEVSFRLYEGRSILDTRTSNYVLTLLANPNPKAPNQKGGLLHSNPIAPLEFHWSKDEGEISTAGPGSLQIDFANKRIGGGVIGRGAVQEEIEFVRHPELIATRAFFEPMTELQVIVMINARHCVDTIGYSRTLLYNGVHLMPRESLLVPNIIVAIDAKNYGTRVADQWQHHEMSRELQKAYIGFSAYQDDWTSVHKVESASNAALNPSQISALLRPISTGNWGCGAFGGDAQLKFLIQLLAASMAGRRMIYWAFSEDKLVHAPYAVELLRRARVTLFDLYQFIFAEDHTMPRRLIELEKFQLDVVCSNRLRHIRQLFKGPGLGGAYWRPRV